MAKSDPDFSSGAITLKPNFFQGAWIEVWLHEDPLAHSPGGDRLLCRLPIEKVTDAMNSIIELAAGVHRRDETRSLLVGYSGVPRHVLEAALKLLRNGRFFVDAIKHVRNETGLGLRESKRVVDKLRQRLVAGEEGIGI